MFNKAKVFLLTVKKLTFLLLTVAAVLTQIACKDDDDVVGDGGLQTDASAIIPTKGKTYTYEIRDEEGTVTTQTTRIKSVRDSSGITVHDIENKISDNGSETVLMMKSYSKSGVTTNEIPLPAAYVSILEEFKGSNFVKSIKITGFPQYQLLENKAVAGSKMTFKGDPIRLNLVLAFEEDGEEFTTEIDAVLTYDDGIVKKVESISTPAGTFGCSKWEYSYELITKTFLNGELQEQTNELRLVNEWTAPGVGIVKSVESDMLGTETSVTELKKVN
jgi:hypothetical protein